MLNADACLLVRCTAQAHSGSSSVFWAYSVAVYVAVVRLGAMHHQCLLAPDMLHVHQFTGAWPSWQLTALGSDSTAY